MNEKIFSLLARTVSAERIQKNTEELHRLEGNESYDNLIGSTDFALRMMKESGFEKVERIPLAADGKTACFDCIMPMAWKTTGRSFLRLEDDSMTMEEKDDPSIIKSSRVQIKSIAAFTSSAPW